MCSFSSSIRFSSASTSVSFLDSDSDADTDESGPDIQIQHWMHLLACIWNEKQMIRPGDTYAILDASTSLHLEWKADESGPDIQIQHWMHLLASLHLEWEADESGPDIQIQHCIHLKACIWNEKQMNQAQIYRYSTRCIYLIAYMEWKWEESQHWVHLLDCIWNEKLSGIRSTSGWMFGLWVRFNLLCIHFEYWFTKHICKVYGQLWTV